jgi:putative serine protease PepD
MTDQHSEPWGYQRPDSLYQPEMPADAPVTAPPTYQVPQPPREPRRPGWIGTVAVGVAAAGLASALTAGVVVGYDHTHPAVATTATGFSTGAPVTSTNGSAPDWTAVSTAVSPSVVAITVDLGNGSGDEGSGVVLDAKGDILTNNHVIAAAGSSGKITATLSDGRIYPAAVVGTDGSTDLAVIKLSSPPNGLKAASFGNSAQVKVGDAVMAIGNPLGLSGTATTGIVSALNRPVTASAEEPPPGQSGQNPFGRGNGQNQPNQPNQAATQVVTNAIQTDAAVNPGNSGGALLNTSGQVIGITSSIASLDSSGSGQAGSIGLGFAIPSNAATDVAKQLMTTGSVQHAYLGVSIQDGTTSLGGAQQNAAIVGAVSSGTPAANGGLQQGDAIIALNGQPISSADSLVGQIRALDAGAKVTLTYVRSGKSQTATVTLAAAPATS